MAGGVGLSGLRMFLMIFCHAAVDWFRGCPFSVPDVPGAVV